MVPESRAMRKLSEADTGSIGGFQPARREVVSKSAWRKCRAIVRHLRSDLLEPLFLANRVNSDRSLDTSEFPVTHPTHECYCCYAAACSSASKRQSQQSACLVKVEPRPPRHQRRRVAIADVAEKIRFHMPFREKLLLARLTFARRKELLIEFCVIKA